jgi:hypothetical protein
MKRGDFVVLSCGGKEVEAMVTLASPNGKSLIVMFDAMVDGHLGMMAIATDDNGKRTALITGSPVSLREVVAR